MELIKHTLLIIILTSAACQDNNLNTDWTKNSTSTPDSTQAILVLDELLEAKVEEGLIYYNGSPFEGKSITMHSDSITAVSISFVNGLKHGLYQKWFKDGTISFEANYENGLQHGSLKTYFPNGNIRSHGNLVDGVAQGFQKQYYESGAKFKFMHLVDGREEGLQQSWRENGKVYNNYEAKNGRIFGLKRASLCYTLVDEVLVTK